MANGGQWPYFPLISALAVKSDRRGAHPSLDRDLQYKGHASDLDIPISGGCGENRFGWSILINKLNKVHPGEAYSYGFLFSVPRRVMSEYG
jgi:hypothetical protein